MFICYNSYGILKKLHFLMRNEYFTNDESSLVAFVTMHNIKCRYLFEYEMGQRRSVT